MEWGAMGVSGTKDKGGMKVVSPEEMFPRLEKTCGAQRYSVRAFWRR